MKSKHCGVYRVLIFSMLILTGSTNCFADCARSQWRSMNRNEKRAYLQGYTSGALFAYRNAFLLNTGQIDGHYTKIIPAGLRMKNLSDMIDSFYSQKGHEKITVSWVLYIYAAMANNCPEEKIRELKEIAVQDFEMLYGEDSRAQKNDGRL